MMTAQGQRTPYQVVSEIYRITKEMAKNKDEIDTVIALVDTRQQLMDEFDSMGGHSNMPSYELEKAREMIGMVIGMDDSLSLSLSVSRDQLKERLSSSKNNHAVLQYTNHALSSSGSYMDYKK